MSRDPETAAEHRWLGWEKTTEPKKIRGEAENEGVWNRGGKNQLTQQAKS